MPPKVRVTSLAAGRAADQTLEVRPLPDEAEVLVAGGGNAALVAALEARARGARVLLLERASPQWRGGNTKYTRNIRFAHRDYPPEELLADLVEVTGDDIDRDLAELAVRGSAALPAWMEGQGVTWQGAFRGTVQLKRTNRFFLGGGKALLNLYYRRAIESGIAVAYDATVVGLEGTTALVERGGKRHAVRARAVVVASGGFEADLGWVGRYWGPAAENFLVRGARHNDGLLLRALLDAGAAERGDPRGIHAVACDARSPRYEGGIVTRVDAIPLGIVVDRDGGRFHDEGEDAWPKRYAVWGRLIAERPGQTAYAIFDDRAWGRFIPAAYPPLTAGSIPELAGALGLDPGRLAATVAEYNRHAAGEAGYDLGRVDGLRTRPGLEPPKSNWALPIDRPPYRAYPLRPGITFTYLGVAVDAHARVLDSSGRPLAGVFAAGEVMAGNILRRGYLGGFGLTMGTVFGLIGGREAAAHARGL